MKKDVIVASESDVIVYLDGVNPKTQPATVRENGKYAPKTASDLNNAIAKVLNEKYRAEDPDGLIHIENYYLLTENEAYYLCAILNSHIVEDYILSTSDKRTFKIRIPVRIMEYDPNNEIHVQLANLSIEAHDAYDDLVAVEKLRDKIDKLYLQSLS